MFAGGGGKNYSYAAASLPFPLPSEAGPLNTARGSVERCKLSHIGSRAKPQPTKRFGAYWSQKVQLWWQNFLLVFLRTNVIFCTKKLDIIRRIRFLTARRPLGSFSAGAVATIANSASMPVDLRHRPLLASHRERKCADTIGTVRLPWAGHFQR